MYQIIILDVFYYEYKLYPNAGYIKNFPMKIVLKVHSFQVIKVLINCKAYSRTSLARLS